MTDKLFSVAGVSCGKTGVYKVRFANDLSRVKILNKSDTDINLLQLPEAMSKSQAVTWLKTSELFANPKFEEAILEADDKYNAPPKEPRVTKEKTAKKLTLEELRLRAEAVTEQSEDQEQPA